jgi:hypothetical protein
VEPSEEKFRRERVLGARTYLEKHFKEGTIALIDSLRKNVEGDEKKKKPLAEAIIASNRPEATSSFSVLWHFGWFNYLDERVLSMAR